jgi:hypothetical protein
MKSFSITSLGLVALLSSMRAEAQPQPSPPAVPAAPAIAAPQQETAKPPNPATATPDDPAKRLEEATKALESASKSLEQAASKLAPKEAEAKELVRIPWQGAFLKISSKEQTAILAYSNSFSKGAGTYNIELSAPLDESTRRVDITTGSGAPNPFRFKLSLEYNSMGEFLRDYVEKGEAYWEGDWCDEFEKEQKNKKEVFACDPTSPKFKEWFAGKRKQLLDSVATKRLPSVLSRPVSLGVTWTLGGEVEGGFDRKSVYGADLAADPEERTRFDFSANVVFQGFVGSYLAIPVRAGLSYAQGFSAREVERCRALPSSDASISGNECSKVLLFDEDAKGQVQGQVEAALVFAIPAKHDAKFQAGAELRGRVAGIGASEVLSVTPTIFLTPTTQPIVSRFGVGVEYVRALDAGTAADASDDRKGTFTPFLLVGGSL